MAIYLKKFDTHSEYEEYAESGGMIKPNVSACVDANDVHYNPYTDPRLIIKYTVEDDSEPTLLYAYYTEEGEEEYWIIGIDLFDKVEIDGVEVSISDIDSDEGNYQLSEGEHIVKYTLKDPTTINYYLFERCGSLTNVVIPNSVTTIGDFAFIRCINLTSITIPNSVTTISVGAFDSCIGLTSITIPNSVTTIDAFAGCSSLTNITIPNSVTSIGVRAFSNCRGLTSVTIPNSVTSIGEEAFYSCTSLTSITIPNSITTIGELAFFECSGLTSVTIQATTPPTLYNSSVFNNTNNCPIYVPSASVNAYKAATNWSAYASRIQAIP